MADNTERNKARRRDWQTSSGIISRQFMMLIDLLVIGAFFTMILLALALLIFICI